LQLIAYLTLTFVISIVTASAANTTTTKGKAAFFLSRSFL
jgi:hypothetical protein